MVVNPSVASAKVVMIHRGFVKKKHKPPKPTRLRRILNAEKALREAESAMSAPAAAAPEAAADPTAAAPDSAANPAADAFACGNAGACAEVRAVAVENAAVAESAVSVPDAEHPQAVEGEPAALDPKPTVRHEVQSTYPAPREYVEQIVSNDLNRMVADMLESLMYYQTRSVAQAKRGKVLRRLVTGLREVQRSADRGKLRLCVVATNIEKSAADGGLDDVVAAILRRCRENGTPVVFALTRNRLGAALGQRIPVATAGVLAADGAHDKFRAVLDRAQAAALQYRVALDPSLTPAPAAESSDKPTYSLMDPIVLDSDLRNK